MGAVGIEAEVGVEGGDGFLVAVELEEGIAAFVEEVALVGAELVGAILLGRGYANVAGDGTFKLLEFGEGEAAFVPEAGFCGVVLEGLVVEGDRFLVFFGFF
jgi:hypothetical protein